jgi:outer membrane protein TolC
MRKIRCKSVNNLFEPSNRSKPKYIYLLRFYSRFKLFLFISIYFYLFLSISAIAQGDSLQNYLELAAKNNPAVLQKFAEYQAALQKVPQVGSLPDPDISLGIFLSPMELVAGNQVADIRLMQMFPWFGVLKNARNEMSLMAKAKFESFRDTKLEVLFELQQTWYDLYKVQKSIAISSSNLEILHTMERLELVRYQSASSGNGNNSSGSAAMKQGASGNAASPSSGMQTMGGNQTNSNGPSAAPSPAPMQGSSGGTGLTDVYRIQMEAGELENNIALLKNQQTVLVSKMNSFLNRAALTPVAVPDTMKPDLLNIPVSVVPDSILANNPMLGMLRYEEKSLEARKQMVTRMGYPMVGLGVNYSLINKNPMSTSSMNGKDMIMPMVTVTLPIYRKKYNAMKTETDLLSDAARHGIKATTNALQTDYYDAIQSFQDAQRRTELYSRQYKLSNQTLNILVRSFSYSGAGLSDLLRARQQTLDYGLKQVDALADLNTAIARLRRLMAETKNN